MWVSTLPCSATDWSLRPSGTKNISEDLLYAVPVPEQAGDLQHHRDNECRLNEQLRLRILRHLPAIGIMISNMKYRAISVRCVTV